MKVLKQDICIVCNRPVFPFKKGEVKSTTMFGANRVYGIVHWHVDCECEASITASHNLPAETQDALRELIKKANERLNKII